MVGGITMAKIIYKEGMEGKNNLPSIEGIEIELLNGQKALIYPKYAKRQMLTSEQMDKWDATNEMEIEALKDEHINDKTEVLLNIGSPAAEWVSQFWSDKYGRFNLPSLLAALEIQHQKTEIDALAETIEGSDLLIDFTPNIWSCSRCNMIGCWCSSGYISSAYNSYPNDFYSVVPIVLYR